eukprot:gnl/TRDRNA2_/TRDRNA2_178003_c9_seq2.p1 gnl/TRDRNA2_/TRDRNA2_178003_c9~~gnl/TRDRNA2_/TRDRNA2_178003_c9_seq2.p1  ORF type:complete len:152 (+),score=29.98 gnl/TRDRNA2_/TRDRNA2_178003_c9_seq2:330-785(+)
MYYTDSSTLTVDVIDYDQATGTLTNRRPAIRVEGCEQVPDGHTLDADGKLWVALFGYGDSSPKGEVRRYDPATGEHLATVVLPQEASTQTTACAFGGGDLDELYITTAHEFWDEEKKSKFPGAGGLYKVSKEELSKAGAGIKGQPVFHFAG